jgi:hypothetical protein
MDAPELVQVEQHLVGGYVIRLPFPMARRVEDGALVFWHTLKGLTFWINVHRREDRTDPLEGWRGMRSPAAYDEVVERDGPLVRYSYRLAEGGDDDRQPALYGFVAGDETEFSIAAYFDQPPTIDDALATWRSIRIGD